MNITFSYHCFNFDFFFSATLCFRLPACLENTQLGSSCNFTALDLQKSSPSPYSEHSLHRQPSLLDKQNASENETSHLV